MAKNIIIRRTTNGDISDVIYHFKDSLVSMRKKIAEKFNVELD